MHASALAQRRQVDVPMSRNT